MYVFSKKKEEINKLDARISVLKMHLKGKIKIKYNKIEKLSKKDQEMVLAVKPNLNTIVELVFNNPADYQTLLHNLVEITNKVSEYVKFKHKHLTKADQSTNEPAAVLSESEQKIENCKKLIKYDKGHVTVVHEIINTTNELRIKIEEYNYLAEYENSQKKIDHIPPAIEIENYDIIHDLILNADKNHEPVDFPILEKSLISDDAA